MTANEVVDLSTTKNNYDQLLFNKPTLTTYSKYNNENENNSTNDGNNDNKNTGQNNNFKKQSP